MKHPDHSAAPQSVRSKPPRWRRLIPYAIGAVLLAAIIAGLWPKPIRVETGAVTRGPLTVSVYEEGMTRIRHRHVISSPVSGLLNRVELRPAAPITAGETVLATLVAGPSGFLDPRSRAQAEARVKATQAAQMARQAEIDRAEASLELARKELARLEALRGTGAISAQDLDIAENRVQVLMRDLSVAEFALKVSEFEVAQAQAALLQAQAPNSEDTEPLQILAPVDGYVLNVYEENARIIPSGTPIMEVGDPRDLEAEIELLSIDAVAVSPGARVSIERWGGDAPLRGRVSVVERGGFTKISALGVEEQRVKVRIDFIDQPPPGRELGDRFRVEARIVTWHGEDILKVPTGALFRRGGHWMAFAVEGGRVRLRKVEIGQSDGISAEVRSGLLEGETVILYPPDNVRESVPVSAGRDNSVLHRTELSR
jgi:HlyD family secretion protein